MDTTPQIDLRDLTLQELTTWAVEQGLSRFRADQIFAWLFRPGVSSFQEMTDLSKKLRETLPDVAKISRLHREKREQSADGTVKYLFRLEDNRSIESVLIPEEDRQTLCVSSQAGCAMGCAFCRTGTLGLHRNLCPSEIVNQVVQVQEDLYERQGIKITNLVFMGMGEPFANFNNLMKALNIIQEQRGLNFSERKITVSTCGLIPQIEEFGRQTKIGLAVSLHAANDTTRSLLMPVNKTYPLTALIQCLETYPLPKRKRIMIEYILLKDINDADSDARQLAKLLRNVPCKINLLPFNPCPEITYQPSSSDRLEGFQEILRNSGYTVLVRNSRGGDISAACGQLAGDSQ